MDLARVLHIARKDLRDFSRDYKSIVAIILLPFIGLPGLALLTGALASQQTGTICVVYHDNSPIARIVTDWILSNASRTLESQGVRVTVREGLAGGGCDLILVVPRGFAANLTSLNETAVILASGGLSNVGQQLLEAVQSAASRVSYTLLVERVSKLAGLAGVRVNPYSFLTPLTVRVSYHTASGAPASERQVLAAQAARILAFSLFFVVNPAIVFMSDALSGERERRTIEMLLVSPASPGEILAGKMIAASAAGLLGAAADSAGILVFFRMSGIPLSVTPGLALVWLAVSVGLIVFSAALAAYISSRTGSVRSAQNLSFLASILALSFYFAALVVDYTKVSGWTGFLLRAIPYSQAALSLEYYAVGEPVRAALYSIAIYLATLAMLAITAKSFKPERLLVSS